MRTAVSSEFELAIACDLSEVGRVSEWLGDIGKNRNLPPSLVSDFDVCAHEAVVNIISYAREEFRHHPILLELSIDERIVALTIRDRGQAFNPLEAPPPGQVASLQEAPIGGLGIHLIRKLMDECSYRRTDGGNCLTLKVYLPVAEVV